MRIALLLLLVALPGWSAVTPLEAAAWRGYPKAQFDLGKQLLESGDPSKYKDGEDWLRKAGNAGHVEAQMTLGDRFTTRNGVTGDWHEGIQWFEKSGAQSNVTAMLTLAASFGPNNHPELAVRHAQRGAELGSTNCRRMDPKFNRAGLAKAAADLAARGVFIGTSSWKYPRWRGQIYDEARYITREKFSESRFEMECLAEFAEVFKAVCVDAAYYRFPDHRYTGGLVSQALLDFGTARVRLLCLIRLGFRRHEPFLKDESRLSSVQSILRVQLLHEHGEVNEVPFGTAAEALEYAFGQVC